MMGRMRWMALLAGWLAAWAALFPGFARAGELPPWFKTSLLDLRDDLSEARHGGRRLLLYFHQEGCPYCARMVADNFGQKAIADKTRGGFDVVAIDIHGAREVTDLQGATATERRFAEAMRVMFTPTLVFLDEKGRTVARLNGYYPPHKFERALEYAAGHAGQGISLAEYLREEAPRPASGRLQQESWFLPPPHDLTRFGRGSHPPLAVLFEQTECGACDALHREVLGREETRRRLEPFAVVQLDMRSATPVVTPAGEVLTAREWAHRLGVEYAPSLLFFDGKGGEVFRIDSWLEPERYRIALDYMASGDWREEPFQRFLMRSAAGAQPATSATAPRTAVR